MVPLALESAIKILGKKHFDRRENGARRSAFYASPLGLRAEGPRAGAPSAEMRVMGANNNAYCPPR